MPLFQKEEFPRSHLPEDLESGKIDTGRHGNSRIVLTVPGSNPPATVKKTIYQGVNGSTRGIIDPETDMPRRRYEVSDLSARSERVRPNGFQFDPRASHKLVPRFQTTNQWR
jgi:hypothetical protein